MAQLGVLLLAALGIACAALAKPFDFVALRRHGLLRAARLSRVSPEIRAVRVSVEPDTP